MKRFIYLYFFIMELIYRNNGIKLQNECVCNNQKIWFDKKKGKIEVKKKSFYFKFKGN